MEISERIISILKERKKFDSKSLSEEFGIEHNNIVSNLLSLSSAEIIKLAKKSNEFWELTKEGLEILENGSHEFRVYKMIPDQGILLSELKNAFPNSEIGINKAMAYKWIKTEKSNDPKVFKLLKDVTDNTKFVLEKINNKSTEGIEKMRIDEFKKRKLIQKVNFTFYDVTPGPNFSLGLRKRETDLTSEMILSGSWTDLEFKPYNFTAYGLQGTRGSFHPLLRVKSEFQRIFLNMGFTEMETNSFVESSFWNFDALFQPQQHPSRDAHDTFFLNTPKNSNYIEKVKMAHQSGINGSLGYRYDWKIEEAQKLILRTHTTASSTRMLYKVAQQAEFKPVKCFSIDRVFRNESSDSTHLSEFHQIEGLIADRNLGLHHLMGILNEFFKQLGMNQLKFKPAFNPYTEPSMEVFSYHSGLKKWVEVGNSGIFRREMLDPMGIPSDVNVLAWGLSLERPAMIKYNINNIRSLIGNRIDLENIKNSPPCLIKSELQ